ncbi:MAG: tol-pal system protein YbgF [Betaproteobacteria bacterium]|nr:tol-pal system protein YbgF [Betaproteobacteria bacterium]
MRAVRGLAAALLIAWIGTAQAQLFGGDDQARRRIEQVRTEVLLNLQQIEERMKTLEATAVERRAILDLAGQLDALRTDLAQSRGQIEVLVHQMEVAEKRQKDLYVDIDTRLRRLEQAAEQQATAGARPPADAGPSDEEKRAYESALNQFKVGNYSAAIDLLGQLLAKYPNGKLAPNAQYWIGMGYSGRRDYRNAITALQKVVAQWPLDPKAADAMLSIASAQEAMGDVKSAQATLQDVLAKYPGSTAADQARLRLQQSVRR